MLGATLGPSSAGAGFKQRLAQMKQIQISWLGSKKSLQKQLFWKSRVGSSD